MCVVSSTKYRFVKRNLLFILLYITKRKGKNYITNKITIIPIDTNKHKCNNMFINNRRRGINTTMILDAIQSKLATLRAMSNSGNIDSAKMGVILDELELLSKIIAYPTSYKVERISGKVINVKLSFDTISDGVTIEF